jgi:hypothetical protein
MKDYTEEELRYWERQNPYSAFLVVEDVQEALQFVLDCLFGSEEVTIHDKVVPDYPKGAAMSFEELTGALIFIGRFLESLPSEEEGKQGLE